MTRRPVALAQIALIDATVVATLIEAALNAMDDGTGGFSETTPGASAASANGSRECPHPDCNNSSPCLIHDPDGAVILTATERLAITTDIAAREREAFTEDVRRMAYHAAAAARRAHQWGLQGVTDSEVRDGLKERLDEIWCKTCSAAGLSNPKTQGKSECRFCEEIRQKGACGVPNPNHFPAPKSLLEIHARRRINSGDFIRCMAAAYGVNWNRKVKKGKVRTP